MKVEKRFYTKLFFLGHTQIKSAMYDLFEAECLALISAFESVFSHVSLLTNEKKKSSERTLTPHFSSALSRTLYWCNENSPEITQAL